MATWGRTPLPSIPICNLESAPRTQEPWEAQEEAHRDRSRDVGSTFRFVCHLDALELEPGWTLDSGHMTLELNHRMKRNLSEPPRPPAPRPRPRRRAAARAASRAA